ncbi:MAG: iron ABC transporter permease [Paludibacteraceae bacterium]|nr:iron ABC transporter permease [Paludibacteraceae bacterium]
MVQRKTSYLFAALTIGLILLSVLDLCSGSRWLNPFAADLNIVQQQVLWQLRLPKMLTAILAGAALSVSGLMMQTLFRNPLAGPYILGVSSGASLGVALVTIGGISALVGTSFANNLLITLTAIAGSLLVLMLVLAIAQRVESNVSLLIVGMMIGSMAGALVNVLQNFANPDALKLFITWTFGSLSSVGWNEMALMCPAVIVGMTCAVMLIKALDGLRLGENYAQGLGINVQRVRLGIVLATGILAGGVTVFCGPIAFVGVAVPHIARGIMQSSSHQLTLPASALIGAMMVLMCDILCSLGTYPLPVSTISALFGAPIIIHIILKKR